MTGHPTTSGRPAEAEGRVQITADVDRPDKILLGLTARQLAILAVPALGLWAVYAAVRHHLPLALFAALGAPVVLGALVLALGRRDGLGLDRLLAFALRQARAPSRLVPAPGGVAPAPAWAGVDRTRPPVPLRLPPRAVGDDGTVDLGAHGTALVAEAQTVSFSLRTPVEQHALVAAFGRYLNSLAAPVQVVVRSEPVDLGTRVAALREEAGGLPHPALEAAALAHAAFVEDLAASRDLLARRVLVVLRDPAGGPDVPARLRRRAADAAASLAAAGINLRVLDTVAATGAVHGALDPWVPPRPPGLAPPDALVTGRATPDVAATNAAKPVNAASAAGVVDTAEIEQPGAAP
ncbi:MAG: PrgI family protein [Actinomycetota bacterium]|jgi:hypothetical protein|nr:PrgI family protein [Actinomycetota bacterium]